MYLLPSVAKLPILHLKAQPKQLLFSVGALVVELPSDQQYDFFDKVAVQFNSTLSKCKQWFEYQHLLLLRDIWWSKL
jgi:hypothetical protein